MATKGFIYVASNESMQGLLKIGRSKNHPDQPRSSKEAPQEFLRSTTEHLPPT